MTRSGATRSGLTDEEIRNEVTQWLDENWSSDRSLIEWRNILVDGGWAAPPLA